jgi:hypothetical protein
MNQFPDFPDEFKTDRRLVLVVLAITLIGAFLLWLADISRELITLLCLALLAALILACQGWENSPNTIILTD